MAELDDLGRKQFTWRDTWPVQLITGMVNAARLPGDVAAGRFRAEPSEPGWWSEEDEARARANESEILKRTLDLAGLVSGANFATTAARGASAKAAQSAAESARSPAAYGRIYDPPVKPQRPFEADYPLGAAADATGKLAVDIEGRPLTAKYIVGRQTVGGPDVGLTPAEVKDVATTLLGGKGPFELAVDEIGPTRGLVGRYDKQNGRRYISVLKTLDPEMKRMVLSHELGHAIEDIAGVVKGPNPEAPGAIPQNGLWKAIDKVYSTLRTGKETEKLEAVPQDFGYIGTQISRELMAEAIRGYLTDPNYLKTVAPKVAARIRKYVNSNPELAKVIQFNSLLGSGLLGDNALRESFVIDDQTGAPLPIGGGAK